MLTYLKVKLATLVFESKHIREKERHYLRNARNLSGIFSKKHQKGEEPREMPEKVLRAIEVEDSVRKAQEAYDLYWGLTHHRKNVVRKEARNTHLAIGFLKGQSYDEMEAFAYNSPNWNDIERMACTYGEGDPRDIKQRFEQWMQEAKAYFEI